MVSHKSFEQDLEVKVETQEIHYWMVAAKMEIHNCPTTVKEGMMGSLLEMVELKETHMLLKMQLMAKAED